jgi:hypothetical protein
MAVVEFQPTLPVVAVPPVPCVMVRVRTLPPFVIFSVPPAAGTPVKLPDWLAFVPLPKLVVQSFLTDVLNGLILERPIIEASDVADLE